MGHHLTGLRKGAALFQQCHPLFCAALVAAAVVLSASASLPASCILTAVLVVLGSMLGSWKPAVGWLLCAVIAGSVFLARTAARDRHEVRLLHAGSAFQRARILSDPRGNDGFWSAAAVVVSGTNKGVRLWWQGAGEMPVEGSMVQAKGNFTPLPAPRNPGEFDRGEWLRQQGVAVVFEAAQTTARVETGRLAHWADLMRHGFRMAVMDGLPEDSTMAKVIRAVVIGEIAPDSGDLVAAYRDSGTLHVFSVSGLHVAMAASVAWLVLRSCRVSRRWAALGLIAVVFGYSWITGNSPPALRSAWMTAIFLGAFIFRRQGNLLNSLGAVLLANLLWDGCMLFQPGVQLSYGVVAAIALGVNFAGRVFKPMAQPELYLPHSQMSLWQTFTLKTKIHLAQYFSVSTAAWAGSTPLTLWHFGTVTPVSILAGLFILPAVYVLLVLGLFSAALHPVVPAASRMLNQLNGKVAGLTTGMARGFSSLPGGHFTVGRESTASLLVYDLRHGAGASCFSLGNGSGILLDAGDRSAFKSRIAPSLGKLGITPDSIIFSHPDGSHLGGGERVWQTFPIRQVVLPVAQSRSPAYQAWTEAAPGQGVRILFGKSGQHLPAGEGAWIEILHVPAPGPRNAEADKRVAIYRLHWKKWKILFTSDAGTDTEMKLLQSGADVSSDVIICGRPRHDANLSDPFLAAVSPTVIVASNADFPASEHLPESQVLYWKSRHIQVVDQKATGGVTFRITDEGDLTVSGFVDGSLLRLKPRP